MGINEVGKGVHTLRCVLCAGVCTLYRIAYVFVALKQMKVASRCPISSGGWEERSEMNFSRLVSFISVFQIEILTRCLLFYKRSVFLLYT